MITFLSSVNKKEKVSFQRGNQHKHRQKRPFFSTSVNINSYIYILKLWLQCRCCREGPAGVTVDTPGIQPPQTESLLTPRGKTFLVISLWGECSFQFANNFKRRQSLTRAHSPQRRAHAGRLITWHTLTLRQESFDASVQQAEEVPCTGCPGTLARMSLNGLQGVWSDEHRLTQTRLLVVEKLPEDVEDHFSAQRELPELILLLLIHEELQLVVGDDWLIPVVAAVKQTQNSQKWKVAESSEECEHLPEWGDERFGEISSQSRWGCVETCNLREAGPNMQKTPQKPVRLNGFRLLLMLIQLR